MDSRRGLYSYDALQTRLQENSFARDGLVDRSGPVVRLANLSPEELVVLLHRVRRVYQASGKELLPDAGVEAFMAHCAAQIGDAYFRTPRISVKAFLDLLAVLDQNPGTDWRDLIGGVSIAADTGDDMTDIEDPVEGVAGPEARRANGGADDELSNFRL
jgi:hypothetical protein